MEPQLNRTGPTIKRGHSKQDYQTPKDFIEAVVQRFGPIGFDLAATAETSQATFKGCFLSKEDNSLEHNWNDCFGNLWLNPPFDNISPWAKKCSEYTGNGKILFLVPASIGTNWFHQYVNGKSFVLGLSPRMKFVGCKDAYIKDLMLCVYGQGVAGFSTWRWK